MTNLRAHSQTLAEALNKERARGAGLALHIDILRGDKQAAAARYDQAIQQLATKQDELRELTSYLQAIGKELGVKDIGRALTRAGELTSEARYLRQSGAYKLGTKLRKAGHPQIARSDTRLASKIALDRARDLLCCRSCASAEVLAQVSRSCRRSSSRCNRADSPRALRKSAMAMTTRGQHVDHYWQ